LTIRLIDAGIDDLDIAAEKFVARCQSTRLESDEDSCAKADNSHCFPKLHVRLSCKVTHRRENARPALRASLRSSNA
jgi:hypothetical protein